MSEAEARDFFLAVGEAARVVRSRGLWLSARALRHLELQLSRALGRAVNRRAADGTFLPFTEHEAQLWGRTLEQAARLPWPTRRWGALTPEQSKHSLARLALTLARAAELRAGGAR